MVGMVNMKIIELSKKQFDDFSFNHKLASFYQSSFYGDLMAKNGFSTVYLGLITNEETLIAATLILTQKKFWHFKSAYSPRGFLIDYTDLELLDIFTDLLKKYLEKNKIIYLRIDPPNINIERTKNGKELVGGLNNEKLVKFMKKIGYEHKGFNSFFETIKPRWNVVTKIDSPQNLFAFLSKETKNKIRKAYKKGITIYKGNQNDIKLFYNFLDKKMAKKLSYYMDQYEIFSKNNIYDLFFAKLNPTIYMKTSKELFERESKRNNKLNNMIQESHKPKKRDELINKKMNSDKLLDIYKSDLINSNKLYVSYPNGVVIAAASVIKFKETITFSEGGYDNNFKHFAPNHLLKWAVMNEYAKKGYKKINHGAITGDFSFDNPYYGLHQFKMGFDGEVEEFIGEFDLVINKSIYHTNRQIKFIKNILEFKKAVK